MKNKSDKWLYWAPRILSILLIFFLAIFSLDVFDEALGFWGTILGLLIHNLPSIILLIVLIISWKREIIAGIIFILAGIAFTISTLFRQMKNGFEWSLLAVIILITGTAIFIGILFIIGWIRRKKTKVN
jgi:hypothetical protein